jgi:malate dehydrogenase (oxaloacetate-decarboxylating)(NADP+)
VGLGVIACRAKHVTDEMFLAAAQTLAAEVTEDDFKRGSIYPPLGHIREISAKIATAVCEVAYKQGHAVTARPDNLAAFIKSQMYEPNYRNYV